ncbi:MAG: glycoside hydrolase family 88 protein, partial [Muribaculaceae bacterium]|nr:glycoside hydrolase family 88 protein [Muribaculaceae bacterium]
MKNGHGGVVIGSEISGGYKTLFVENCKMDSPDLERVIRIKTNPCRGGEIEDVYVRNVEVGQCDEAVLKINLDYEPNEKCRRDYPPTVKNVYLENVTCNKSKYGVMIVGLKDRCNVYDIELKDCSFSGVAAGNNITGQVRDVVFDNVKINGVECLYGKPMAYKMAKSEMTRIPESRMIDVNGVKWSYAAGVELDGILAAAKEYGDKDMLDYVLSYCDFFVNPDGSIKAFKKESYNIDNVKNGTVLMQALDITGEPRYRMALDTIYSQLLGQPRTKTKNFWHKQIYPWQAWLDGLYMGQPFYAEYVNRYLDSDPKLWDDIANQFITVGKKTYDPATGLYRHAWDEKKKQFWADKKTGQSKHAWGRAMGWYVWAITDVLEKMPADHPKRPEILALLKSVADGIVKYQDPKTGVWYQVMDSPEREGNYLEATASAMFTYNLMRAVRLGLLDESYLAPAKKGYEGILETFIKENPDGTISLTDCCAVAGLGGGKDQRRDGTFEYYLSEPIRDNDSKGIGPFILGSLEYDNLSK